jgi:predicted nucleotidyltransferase
VSGPPSIADSGERVGVSREFFGLLEGLSALFQRKVDLVTVSAVKNPYLLQSIERSRTLLYAA